MLFMGHFVRFNNMGKQIKDATFAKKFWYWIDTRTTTEPTVVQGSGRWLHKFQINYSTSEDCYCRLDRYIDASN